MTEKTSPSLPALIESEISRSVMAEAEALASAILDAHGDAISAIVFYGSCLRSGDPTGMLDFYVLVDDYAAYYGKSIPAFFNRVLPPNVSYWEIPGTPEPVRAKVAVISLTRFAASMRPEAVDTTMWARFAQPTALIYARDDAVRAQVVDALADALATAVHWAAHLGPEKARPEDYWSGLFRATYAAELRVETQDRSSHIISADPERYAALFRPALERAGILWTEGEGEALSPTITQEARERGQKGWRSRRWKGKVLNISRLVKAAFTFEGGADYLAWKIERHTGKALNLTPWQRRHPVLAAPGVWLRLWRQGGFR